MKLRIGTRSSHLALRQTELVKERIQRDFPNTEFQLVSVTTAGDRNHQTALADIGGKGLFTEEMETLLRNGEIDLAVHSGKDLPSGIEEEFSLLAINEREDPADVIVTRKGAPEEYDGLLYGTSSPRRSTLLKRRYPNAKTVLLRGNVDTRLEKLRNGICDAAILAYAGLKRLGTDLSDFSVKRLAPEEFLPSCAQGILVCETVKGSAAERFLEPLVNDDAQLSLLLERRLLSYMKADCRAPAAVWSDLIGTDTVRLLWFYGNSEIQSAVLDRETARDIAANGNREWEKRIGDMCI